MIVLWTFQILTFEDEQVFQMNVVVFNGATDGDDYCNMQAVDLQVVLSSGTMKVIFLNKFVSTVLVSIWCGLDTINWSLTGFSI